MTKIQLIEKQEKQRKVGRKTWEFCDNQLGNYVFLQEQISTKNSF